MDNNQFFNSQLGIMVAHGLVAFAGACTHALRAHRNGSSKGFLDFLILTIMSSFSGILFALVAFQLFDTPYITLAVTGAGGFLGVEGLTILAEKLRDSLLTSLNKIK